MIIEIPVSTGELLDKITILKIKSENSDNEYVIKELKELTKIAEKNSLYNEEWISKLYDVNKLLWSIEDHIRIKEKQCSFDNEFIELARSVYIKNDERARIKREINDLTKSNYKEIKIWSPSNSNK
jgi:hypothetical protein